jgi:hypothetical protein
LENLVAENKKRAALRNRTLIAARISYGEGVFSTECTVSNLSSRGALLNLAHSIALTDQFEIAIPQKDIACRARLVWRNDGHAGIEFLDPSVAPSASDGDDRQGRIRGLEAENVKLRGQLSFLLKQVHRLTEE